MDNIYFKPTEENGEFLEKLEGLDEYSVPQILDRMVEYFRTVELKDALIKLSIKTDSLEEEIDDDVRVEKRFWSNKKTKRIRHFKGDDPNPILMKEWYKNGQLQFEEYTDKDGIKIFNSYWINGDINEISKRQGKDANFKLESKTYWKNGNLAHTQIAQGKYKKEEHFYDPEGNEMKQIEWSEARYGRKSSCNCYDDNGNYLKLAGE